MIGSQAQGDQVLCELCVSYISSQLLIPYFEDFVGHLCLVHSLYTVLNALVLVLPLHPGFNLFHLEGALVRHKALVLRVGMVKLADGVRDFARHDRVH